MSVGLFSGQLIQLILNPLGLTLILTGHLVPKHSRDCRTPCPGFFAASETTSCVVFV